MIIKQIEPFDTRKFSGHVIRTGKPWHDKDVFIRAISNYLELNENEIEELIDIFKDYDMSEFISGEKFLQIKDVIIEDETSRIEKCNTK